MKEREVTVGGVAEEVAVEVEVAMVAAAMAAASSMRRLHPPDVSQSEPRPSR